MEKPSDCFVVQAGVKRLEREHNLWIKIGVALVITTFVLSLSCNLTLYLWVRNIDSTMAAIVRLNQELMTTRATKDYVTELDEDEVEDNTIQEAYVRISRDGKIKRTKKTRGKRRRRKRHDKCKCEDVVGSLKRMVQKRNAPADRPVTHLKSIQMGQSPPEPVDGEGVFLWQKPELSYGSFFEYGFETGDTIHSIKINSPGIYELYSQITLYGSRSQVTNRECGHDLIRSTSGQNITLARSVITQVDSYRQDNVERYPLDSTYLKGFFFLDSGDRVFVRRHNLCPQVRLLVNQDLSYFGALQVNVMH